MENDFSKDFSAQSRDEWRAVKLTKWEKSLTAKELRTFQQQFETVADLVCWTRANAKHTIYCSINFRGYWQEKVVKEERTQRGNKFRVGFGTVRGLKRRELMEILECADVKYESIKGQSNGFFFEKFENEGKLNRPSTLTEHSRGRKHFELLGQSYPSHPRLSLIWFTSN
jgi:hypothetical protein